MNQIKIVLPKSLINGINQNYKKAQDSSKQAIIYAIKTGEFLLKAKAKIPHGEWKNYLQNSSSGLLFSSDIQARKYMKLAKNPELAHIVKSEDSSFNLDELNKAIANASDEDKEEAKEKKIIAELYTGNNEWFTPPCYIESARKVMGSIDLDPASNDHAQKTVMADTFYTIGNSGLEKEWTGNIWINPPYSAKEIKLFVDKFLSSDFDQAVVLTNNSADTSWFVNLARSCNFMCFTSGRIKFHNKEGEQSAPTNGQTFFYFGNNTKSFVDEFKQYGMIMGVVTYEDHYDVIQ